MEKGTLRNEIIVHSSIKTETVVERNYSQCTNNQGNEIKKMMIRR